MGRWGTPTRHTMGQRRLAALAAETDGSAIYGAADGPPFPFPTGDWGEQQLELIRADATIAFVPVCATSRQDSPGASDREERIRASVRVMQRFVCVCQQRSPRSTEHEHREASPSTWSSTSEPRRRPLSRRPPWGRLAAGARPGPDSLAGWSAPQGRPPDLVQRLTCTAAPYERRGDVRRLEERKKTRALSEEFAARPPVE
jgi:hypothetical protein